MNKKDLVKGKTVTYTSPGNGKKELGKITSWNDYFVFVDYGGGTSQATRIEDLQLGDQTFYCPDEHNSVLDGAFGRCETQCFNCKQMHRTLKTQQ